MKNPRLRIIISASILAVMVNVIIIYLVEEDNADYIIIKISGDASEFNGFINSLDEKGHINSIKFENELPQEHKLKTQKVYCQIKLIKGDYLFVEYWSKGMLSEKDTVNFDLYKNTFSVDSDKKNKY